MLVALRHAVEQEVKSYCLHNNIELEEKVLRSVVDTVMYHFENTLSEEIRSSISKVINSKKTF